MQNLKCKIRKLSTLRSRPSTHSGFTLVEMLVTTAIFAIIVASVYTAFKGGLASWVKGDVRMQRYQNARAILEQMSREISSAIVSKAGKIYCLGIDETETRIKTGSAKDEFFFIAPLSTSDSTSDLCEIGYWLRGSDNTLMRVYVSNPNFIFEKSDHSDQLGDRVTDLQFEYWDGSGWRIDWPDTSPFLYAFPKAIKISLTVQDEREREPAQTFTTVVYIPGGGQ